MLWQICLVFSLSRRFWWILQPKKKMDAFYNPQYLGHPPKLEDGDTDKWRYFLALYLLSGMVCIMSKETSRVFFINQSISVSKVTCIHANTIYFKATFLKIIFKIFLKIFIFIITSAMHIIYLYCRTTIQMYLAED